MTCVQYYRSFIRPVISPKTFDTVGRTVSGVGSSLAISTVLSFRAGDRRLSSRVGVGQGVHLVCNLHFNF